MVYESWEGSHNVLVAQVLTDLRRLPILDEVDRWFAHRGGVDGRRARWPPGSAEELDAALDATRSCMDDPVVGAWQFRDVVGRIGLLAEACLLAAAGEEALARTWWPTRLTPGYRPEDDPDLVGRVEAVLHASG